MKPTTNKPVLLFAFLLFMGYAAVAQSEAKTTSATTKKTEMKTYVIEREIPNAGSFTALELKNISQKSCTVLKEMGPQIEWVESYVTGNKIYCIYKAENAELVKEHAKRGGFPANSIAEVSSIISPATAAGN